MPCPIFFEGWAAHNLLPRLRSRRLGEDEFDRRTKKEGSLHVRRTALCWERSDPPRHFVGGFKRWLQVVVVVPRLGFANRGFVGVVR